MERSVDVIVEGASLHGLYCALHLQESGLRVLVIDPKKSPGGRLASIREQGFVLDEGLLPAVMAPGASRSDEWRALAPAAYVRRRGRIRLLQDPLAVPSALLTTLCAPVGRLGDRLQCCGRRLRKREYAGASPAFHSQVVGPLRFSLQGESDIFHLLFSGRLALPAGGWGATIDRLVKPLKSALMLDCEVGQWRAGRAVLSDGSRVASHAFVLARDDMPPLAWFDTPLASKRLGCCFYFAAEKSPLGCRSLMLSGEEEGPICALCVPSDIDPSRAPAGASLVMALSKEGGAELLPDVREQLERWFGPCVRGWQELRISELSALRPAGGGRPFALPHGRFVVPPPSLLTRPELSSEQGVKAAQTLLECCF